MKLWCPSERGVGCVSGIRRGATVTPMAGKLVRALLPAMCCTPRHKHCARPRCCAVTGVRTRVSSSARRRSPGGRQQRARIRGRCLKRPPTNVCATRPSSPMFHPRQACVTGSRACPYSCQLTLRTVSIVHPTLLRGRLTRKSAGSREESASRGGPGNRWCRRVHPGRQVVDVERAQAAGRVVHFFH